MKTDNNASAQREYDVIIIGGGATGAGTARDCALRGLSVLLLERFDFTAGATGRNQPAATCTAHTAGDDWCDQLPSHLTTPPAHMATRQTLHSSHPHRDNHRGSTDFRRQARPHRRVPQSRIPLLAPTGKQ